MATKRNSKSTTTLSANGRQRKEEVKLQEPKRPLKERLTLSENQRWVICFILFFVSAFVTLSIVSHYFTWQADQIRVTGVPVSNSGGSWGLGIANLLVGEWFGIFALCIPVAGFLLSLRVHRGESGYVGRVLKVLVMVMILGSITFGFVTGTDGAFGSGLGGKMGIDVAVWTATYLGRLGLGLLLFMCWVLVAVYINSSRTIEAVSNLGQRLAALFKSRPRTTEEETEEDERIVANYGEEEGVDVLSEDEEDYSEEDAAEEDADLEIIVPEEEETTIEEPTVEDYATERVDIIDEDLVEVDEQQVVVPQPTPQPTTTHTVANNSIDDDFEIIDNAVEGMKGLPKPTSAAEEMTIGTGGVVETAEDGSSQVILSEHNDEEAGKIGTLYDPTKELSKFQRPPVEILEKYDEEAVQFSTEEINENKTLIKQTLDSFGVKIKKITATIGPTVTLYEIEPEMGVKVARIKSLEDDIAISLKAMSIRLIIPMPGRGTIGIEIPNRTRRTVSMYSVMKSKKFQESKAALPVVIGKTIQNETFVFDLAEMPHMIVAGATGQGKSVGLNAIIASLIYKKHPAELKFVMVDPKKVELSLYAKLEKHYLAKMESEEEAILTDTQKVVYTLNSLCNEMEERYKLLRAAGVKRIDAYNQKFLERKLHPKYGHRYLPYLVVVIDEFADMIMTAGKEVETPIVRLGQLARAIGIHLIIATQRPDAKVITGLISANCPSRIAFKVTNRINSQIILGGTGAEKLIGKGDMLVQINGAETRLQCAFIDTPEIERITDFVARQRGYESAYLLPDYVPEDGGAGEPKEDVGDLDSMFDEVARFVVANQQGSTSFIQRKFKIGYNRAGRIMDQLEAFGIVGKSEGSKPREVLISDPASLERTLNDIFIENL
ncbi:MAG: DNA translocase FtsK 4TM domain-containing protein [Tidjanibacter sp.]|nr:DNA translocase FtsK 4TM domain-containing protein [Tidjanibacter sp.]